MIYADTKHLNNKDIYTCIIGRRGSGKAYAQFKYLQSKNDMYGLDDDERDYYEKLQDWLVIEHAEKIS